MPKRKRGAPLCTINIGVPDREFAMPEGCCVMHCPNCTARWLDDPARRPRCICGSRLRRIIPLRRLTLGALKQALRESDR